MHTEDYLRFASLWRATHESMAAGKNLSEAALELVFEDLSDYPFEIVRMAIMKHRKTAQFAPTVFNIVEIIKRENGLAHMGAEQAWAIAQGFYDESNTVIATPEMMQAWCVASETDKYSAAKAFKETYAALVNPESMPVWQVFHGSGRIGSDGRPSAPMLFNPTEKARLSHSAGNEIAVIDTTTEKARLSHSAVKALDERMLLSAPPETTIAALLENHAQKTNNVIDFKTGLSLAYKAIYGGVDLSKTKAQMYAKKEQAARKKYRQDVARLKIEQPELFREKDEAEAVSA